MAIIIFIILMVFVTYKLISSKNNNNTHRDSTAERVGVHCTIETGVNDSFSSVLNKLQQIVESVAIAQPGTNIQTLIMIKNTYLDKCTIGFAIEDLDFKVLGITFGNEFKMDGYSARFKYEEATKFVSVENAKQEILLQFNWEGSGVSTTIIQMDILNQGDYKDCPLITCRLVAKKQ